MALAPRHHRSVLGRHELAPPPRCRRARPARPSHLHAAKQLWLETTSQDAMTAAVESGVQVLVFAQEGGQQQASSWQKVARFRALHRRAEGLYDGDSQAGRIVRINGPEDLRAAEALAGYAGVVLMDAADWKVIPAENLVAALQGGPAQLFACAGSAAEAQLMLEALEVGVQGVLLRCDDPAQVRQAAAYIRQRNKQDDAALQYEAAEVVRLEQVGMGDRACVDLCSMLAPGEGMLVGSFARALFLVHSECEESAYINSRPFRVNAGPVHAYTLGPGNRTAYLSELASGREVLVAGPQGRLRPAVVGRVKIEARPLVLVEARTGDGQLHSALLQNAETVKLVGLASGAQVQELAGGGEAAGPGGRSWRAISVTEMAAGDRVLVLRQGGARHTGISIQESIVEK